MVILFGGLSFQGNCYTLSYPSVGMLSNAFHKLHFDDAKGLARNLCTDLLGDMKFYIERLSEVLIGEFACLGR